MHFIGYPRIGSRLLNLLLSPMLRLEALFFSILLCILSEEKNIDIGDMYL